MKGEGPKFISTVSRLGLKFVHFPNITIISCATLMRQYAIGFIAFARDAISTASLK